ncbi:MAG: MarR family winged helix-turn-helix transcriptional regulator [Gemmatimonas sp.]
MRKLKAKRPETTRGEPGRPQGRGPAQARPKASNGAKQSLADAPAPPPPVGQGKRGEEGYLGYLLRQAQAASRLTLERSLGEVGATVPQFVVLTMLKAYPGLSGADLARVALLTPQTIGVIIRNLERDGAIRKTPHPVHGRILQWTLTAHGSALLEQCRKRAIALEQRLAAGLTPKDQRTIRHWLANIAVSLQQDG